MKTFVNLIVIVIAVFSLIFPCTCFAEEGWYRQYDNSNKTVILDTIKQAINNGDVEFDTQSHKNQFLDDIDHVYYLRDNQNWSGIVNFIDETMTAETAWVSNSNQRSNIKNFLYATEDAYDNSSYEMTILESDLDTVMYSLCSIHIRLVIDIGKKHQGAYTVHDTSCTTTNYGACESTWNFSIKLVISSD